MPSIKMDSKNFDLLCCNWIRSVQIRYSNCGDGDELPYIHVVTAGSAERVEC